MRESYSIPLTTTPHAPKRMDTPEKRYTQIGRAPESKNVNPNRFAKSATAERGTPAWPCLCRPPVMKTTSVVLGNGGYWTVPLLGGKPAFSARAPEPFETGFWGRIQGQSPGLGAHSSARNPAAGKPGETRQRPLTRPGSRTGHDARDAGQVHPAALQLVGVTQQVIPHRLGRHPV